MKRFVLCLVLILAGCGPSAQAIQEAIAQTQAAGSNNAAGIQTGIAQTQGAMPTQAPAVEAVKPTDTPAVAMFDMTAMPKVTADSKTWPPGFSEEVGQKITYHTQMILMNPEKYGYPQSEANTLKALESTHPEWTNFIEYILKKGWTY